MYHVCTEIYKKLTKRAKPIIFQGPTLTAEALFLTAGPML